jgi:hypothetical protein
LTETLAELALRLLAREARGFSSVSGLEFASVDWGFSLTTAVVIVRCVLARAVTADDDVSGRVDCEA